MTKADLRLETQRMLGKRTSTELTSAWYDTRVLNAYRRLVTFQGVVNAPGFRHPIYRVLRFPILEDRLTRTLDTSMTSNFVANASGVIATVDLYNRTDNLGIPLRSSRVMRQYDPDENGKPEVWQPGAVGGSRGYFVWPYPGAAADNIDVYEYVINDVSLAADTTEPAIEDEWHIAIAYAAAAEGARLLEMPERAGELDTLFTTFIAERQSPGERTAFAGRTGQRRYIQAGGWNI